jgi:spermidine synthase
LGEPEVSYLASAHTALGTIYLLEREILSQPGTLVLELFFDHALLMSSLNTHSERELARQAIAMRARGDLHVLVGGLGLGYTAREVLDSNQVASLAVVEFLPELIGWFESGVIPLGAELRRDPRFALRRGDVYQMLAGPPPARRYDVILIDVDHGPEAHLEDANAAFYTEAVLRSAREHLVPEGILGVWSYAESSAFGALLGRVFSEVRIERLAFRNPVLEEDEVNWLFLARR